MPRRTGRQNHWCAAACNLDADPSTVGALAMVGLVNARSLRRSSRQSSATVSKNPTRLSSKFLSRHHCTKKQQKDMAGKLNELIMGKP
jgi:hypothetical protein